MKLIHEYPANHPDFNYTFFDMQMIQVQFSELIISNKTFFESFIMILASSLSLIEFKFIDFLNVTSENSLVTISNSNLTRLLNFNFLMTTTNRNLHFIDCNFVEIVNCTFYKNDVHFISIFLESTLMLFDNVYNKSIDSIFVGNCSSYFTTPVIKIISTNEFGRSTQISNSIFHNNRLLYQNNNQGGVVLYVISQNENISFRNLIFDSNYVFPLQQTDRIGASCAKLNGEHLNISIIDSIFRNNQAVFGCNCIEFDGFELKINNSIFSNNRNYLPPKSKDVIEAIGDGGSIYTIGESLIINNSQFDNNMNYLGGNIYLNGNMRRTQMKVIIDKTNFIDNYSHTFGSVFYLAKNIKHLMFDLEGCLFYRNWANYNAVIFMNFNSMDGITSFKSSHFIESWSDFTPVFDFEGETGICYIKNCSFFNNTASFHPRDPNYFEHNINDDYGCGGVIGINAQSGPTNMYL